MTLLLDLDPLHWSLCCVAIVDAGSDKESRALIRHARNLDPERSKLAKRTGEGESHGMGMGRFAFYSLAKILAGTGAYIWGIITLFHHDSPGMRRERHHLPILMRNWND